MRTIRTVAELRTALAAPRRAGRTIGLVPTMGAFHEGHLSLMREARRECDLVVVSLFVNPTQFNDAGDLDRYPRDERGDAGQAADAGADILFAPAVDEVYPDGFTTTVTVGGVSAEHEGRVRGPEHFAGVATVVTKLFHMVAPDVAFFGQKDIQQTLVIRRLVRDLDIPVRIEVCPTIRAADGLALSSRNARLTSEERVRARAIPRALRVIRSAVAGGERSVATLRSRALAELTAAGVEPEYLEIVAPDTLAPIERVAGDGDALAIIAARIGGVRLIDNDFVLSHPPVARAA
jgi:pantoate--beta-alanine ligase